MLQNLENCIPWCGWIFVHIPVSSGLYLGWTRPEEAGKVIVNSSFMSNEFMTWGSWKCSSNHRCNSKSIGFDGCHWRNPSKTCPVGWRYYTIYDLANKRIGLALARQPVGQAGNFLVKKTPGRRQKKKWLVRLEVSSPASVGAPPAGSLLSGEAFQKMGTTLSPLKYVETEAEKWALDENYWIV